MLREASMRLTSFKYLVNQGFKGIWYNRVNSFASFCIITISLFMVGLSLLVSANISRIIGDIERRNEIIVIIRDGTPDNNITILGEQLKANDNIVEINFYSKEDAWTDMLADMSDEEKSLFQYLENNPLPDTYKVRIERIEDLSETVSEIKSMDAVELVNAPNDFASLLVNIRNVCAVMFTVITVALIIICLVIISNTTRTSVFARRKEIYIMRYVGASRGFIRIPFFVEGLVIGLISAVCAYGLTWFGYSEIYSILTEYLKSWNFISTTNSDGLIPMADIALIAAIGYLVCGIIISAFGTVISTRKHLKV